MNRREVIKIGAATAAAALVNGVAGAQTKPLRVLILGGTGFIGPHMIEALRKRGHEVTLFNNDKLSKAKFPDLESLFGDRDGDIAALRGRDWDVVVDNSGYVPRIVKISAQALKDHVRHYVYISSISAYADLSKPGIDESSPLATLKDPKVEKVTSETYGGLKVACEKVITDTYGQQHCTIIRPSYIVGPGDSTDRFTYWPVRVSRGGEMLAPGSAADPVQFIDVRDLANFTRDCVEQRHTGAYNICIPPRQVTMGEVLEVSRKVSKADTQFTWVDAQFLTDEKLAPGPEIPIWASPSGQNGGIALVKSDRAVAKGLKFRPLETTVRDTLAWHAARPPEEREKLKAGLTPEREREILKKWKQAPKS